MGIWGGLYPDGSQGGTPIAGGALCPKLGSPGRVLTAGWVSPPCPDPRICPPQLFPLTLRVTGLEGVPEGALPDGGVPPGLGWAAQRLQLFQRLLGALAGDDLRLAQVANDLENLRSLLAVLGALLGCPPPHEPPPAPPAPLAEAPHTVAGVALARLRGCLEGVAARLEGVPAC